MRGTFNSAGESSKTKTKSDKKQAGLRPAFVEWEHLDDDDLATLLFPSASDFDSSLLFAGIKQLDCGSVDFPFTKYVAYFPICKLTNFAVVYMQTLSLEHLKASAIRGKLSSSIRPKIATNLPTGLSSSYLKHTLISGALLWSTPDSPMQPSRLCSRIVPTYSNMTQMSE